MQNSVRIATLTDANLIAPLFDLYRQFYRQKADAELALAFITERLSAGESTIFIAEDENKTALGFVQLYPVFSSVSAQKSLLLNDLFVAKGARRRGIAKLLMEAARKFAVDQKVKGLSLETEKNNHQAQALYEDLGYIKETTTFQYFLSVTSS